MVSASPVVLSAEVYLSSMNTKSVVLLLCAATWYYRLTYLKSFSLLTLCLCLGFCLCCSQKNVF